MSLTSYKAVFFFLFFAFCCRFELRIYYGCIVSIFFYYVSEILHVYIFSLCYVFMIIMERTFAGLYSNGSKINIMKRALKFLKRYTCKNNIQITHVLQCY